MDLELVGAVLDGGHDRRFQFVAAAGKSKIEGTAKLKRLEFGVGQGDWKSTAEVKDEVKVAFSLVLKPAP